MIASATNMQLRSNISIAYPDGPDAPPVCNSADVIAEYGLGDQAIEYMRLSSRERRQGLAGGRSPKSVDGPLHLYKYRPLNSKDPASVRNA